METLSQSWKEYKTLISSSFKFVLKYKLIQWNILFFSITSPIFVLIANDGIIKNIFIQFYLLVFLLFIMYFSYQKIPKKYFTVKDDVFDKQ